LSSNPGSRYASEATRPPGVSRQHTLLYRAANDSRIDRWNIALLKRIIRKSTTPASLEVYYHEPAKLLDWAEPHEGVRYIRLRSGEHFPFAERIAAATTDTVVVFDDSLLLAAADVWRLMGLAERNSIVQLDTTRTHRRPGESTVNFLWRAARMALKNYLYPQGAVTGHAFAIHKKLLNDTQKIRLSSFHEKKNYSDYLQAIVPQKAEIIRGDSFAVNQGTPQPLLGTGAATVSALRTWNAEKKFPDWFSGRFLLFHVAQLAAYYGALVFYISPKASLIVFLFAAAITPQFLFKALPLWRRPHHALAQTGMRFLLYFVG
jgi:hypothetical protein